MKLNDNLYTILDRDTGVDEVVYSISLLPSWPIYAAHFPGMPITPGVCQIQLVKELLEDYMNISLTIKGVKNAKFVSVLKPLRQTLKVRLSKVAREDNDIKVQATIADDSTIYAKLSLQTVIA